MMISSIDALNQADRTLHSLSQLIALTGTNRLATQPDDSQANLDWNPGRHRLEGRPFVQNDEQVRLVFDTDAFAFYFVDGREHVSASFSPANRTPADAMAWWKSQMQAWGIAEIRGLTYQLDQAPIALESVYERPVGLSEWGNWRTVAADALNALTAWSGRKSEVNIWPHHFDTGVYYAIPDETGAERAAIWAGFAIADAVSVEPYFYLSGYDRQQPIDFNKANGLTTGKWLVTPDWQGAYLSVSMAANPEWITRFFEESYSWVNSQVN